jgi:trehalose/maltose hydrolase-like predicted phosphorylase
MPSIITCGFMGIDPQGQSLNIAPALPEACPEMTIRKMQYHNVLMDIRCTNNSVSLALRDEPVEPIVVVLDGSFKNTETGKTGSRFELPAIGSYRFVRE